jgi:hypothetical protein
LPQVRLYENEVQRGGGVEERLRAADYGPSPLAVGLQKLGKGVAEFADQQDQINDEVDRAAAKEAVTAGTSFFAEQGYTGQDPYFSKKGKDALTTRPTFEKGLGTQLETLRKGLSNDRQRQYFDNAINPQRQSWGIQIASHADKEGTQYQADEAKSRAGMSGELGRAMWLNDPVEGDKQIATGAMEIANYGHFAGWGPDQIKAEQLKYSSGAYRDVGTSIVTAGQDGPTLARAFVDKYGKSMTGDDRSAVLTHAETQQNHIEAEQRRAEAEQRRIDREARQDKKDAAQSVYRNIQDGIVVDPKDLASAITNATEADDPALAEGLRQGGLKNNLTQQWANATPSELQQRVNDLSAQITKAGGKVKPDLIVERDHLQTLVGKSRSALNSDPLSWGAEHLGIKVAPLNLNDQGSINDRIQAATLIARRTGTMPAPLMQDEVAATQQTLQHGTTEQKVALAMRLAKMGPLALPAADQLTNNTGFHNLIGLATLSNRGVAASRVNQVVTGYEVLKTKPKLIDKNQAQQQFNSAIGSALQFLPQVSQGVFSNAQALLATQANEHGWNEWGEAQGGWLPAINSALGAYSRDGKRIGGLWTLNGGTTILPEGMTGAEFEDRIAKSHGAEFRRAQNDGPAPMANGQIPTATDLKRMQWVPTGDGVYRLTDGNGFVHTKSGGFYEVDATKLNPNQLTEGELARLGYVRR